MKQGAQDRRTATAVTDRDIEIVRWLGRHRLATAEQVMRRFEMQRSKAYQRLAVLVAAGLVRHEPGVRSPRVYLATSAGLAGAKLDLPRATVSAASFAHDVALVDVAIPLERAGHNVCSEREIRRHTSDDGSNPFQLRLLGSGSDARGAWPDLALVDHCARTITAIEVELTLKKAERLAGKLTAYVASNYARVIYLCDKEPVAQAVRAQAARVGMAPRVEVKPLSTDLARELFSHGRVAQEESAPETSDDRAAQLLLEEIAGYLSGDSAVQQRTLNRWKTLVQTARTHGLLAE